MFICIQPSRKFFVSIYLGRVPIFSFLNGINIAAPIVSKQYPHGSETIV